VTEINLTLQYDEQRQLRHQLGFTISSLYSSSLFFTLYAFCFTSFRLIFIFASHHFFLHIDPQAVQHADIPLTIPLPH